MWAGGMVRRGILGGGRGRFEGTRRRGAMACRLRALTVVYGR